MERSGELRDLKFMPIWRVTVTQARVLNGKRMDKGLFVDIQSGYANPIYNDKDAVQFAFKTKNVDLEAMGALNSSCLTAVRIG